MTALVAILLSLSCLALLAPLLMADDVDFDRVTANYLWCIEVANAVAATLTWVEVFR